MPESVCYVLVVCNCFITECIVCSDCRLMYCLPCASRQIPENCRSEFMQHVGVGLEPLLSCLVASRQFTYLLTAVRTGATALYEKLMHAASTISCGVAVIV